MASTRTCFLWCALAGALVAGACVSLEQRAPIVDDRIAAAAERRGDNRESALRGRDVFIGECRTCHSLNTPTEYSEVEWEDILPTMNKKAELTRAQAADLRAYILAARAAGPPPR